MNPDVELPVASAPPDRRAAIHALWSLDDALGRVLATGREPMISRIRLAWWREALEKLDAAPAPREPVLEALAAHVLPLGITGRELSAMEEGWLAVVGDEPIEGHALDHYARSRGALLFTLTARLLGSETPHVAPAGEAWALVDLARHSTEDHDIEAALAAARDRPLPRRWPKSLRLLGMLAMLTARDLKRGRARWEEPGSPPRVARMLRHRLTGW
jgi:phytoene synthase